MESCGRPPDLAGTIWAGGYLSILLVNIVLRVGEGLGGEWGEVGLESSKISINIDFFGSIGDLCGARVVVLK
jgi:hypothetical protein